jgi:hypothetical protein
MFSATTGLSKEPSSLIKMDEPEEQVNTRPAPKLLPVDNFLALNIQNQLNRAETNKAVDIRPPATAVLTINSADRYNPITARYNNPANGSPYTLTSPADFTINVPGNIMNGSFTRVAVTNLIYFLTWGAWTPATSYFYINWQPGGVGAVTQYLINTQTSFSQTAQTFSTIATNIQTAVRTATGSTTFTFTNTPSTVYYFTSSSGNTDKYYFSRWTSPSGPTAITAFELLGLNPQQILATSQQGIITYQNYRTTFVDIICESITANQMVRDGSTGSNPRTLLARVYVAAENLLAGVGGGYTGGQPICFVKSPPIPKQIALPANQPIGGTLRIQCLDDRGNVLTNGGNFTNATYGYLEPWSDACQADWSMTLQFTEQ